MDTGAIFCALHALNIREKRIRNRLHVMFETVNKQGKKIKATLPVYRILYIRSSMGHVQKRYAVILNFKFSGRYIPALTTLVNRSTLRHTILIGREFMRNRLIVDPARKYLISRPHWL